MDWSVILTSAAVLTAAASVWKTKTLKKEIYDFSDRLEADLDRIITGEELEIPEETADTLYGKIGEKLTRLRRIQILKEEDSIRKKEQMKELISDISHQTKTPIANIRLYLEFLQDESLSEKGEEFLEKLDGQTEKLDFLIQSMVKMSRLEAGSIEICKNEANLYETIGRALETIVPAASKKQIALYADCPKELFVKHDRKWTEEAIFNVLDNAVKYTDAHGSIHITALRQEMFTKLEIRDSGKGIAPHRQAQIFTRFYREPEVHDAHGVGIGLYLVRKIMEMQNGYVEVRSEEGCGAAFCLYFPNQ